MADTGLTVFAAGFLADDFFAAGFWSGGAPAPSPSPAPSASGGFFFGYDHAQAKRNRRKRELEEMAREQEAIEDEQAREIAKLLRIQEEKDAEREDLARIQALADQYAQRGVDTPRPLLAAVMKAHEERTKNALEQLQREIQRMYDEEEQAIVSLLLMDD